MPTMTIKERLDRAFHQARETGDVISLIEMGPDVQARFTQEVGLPQEIAGEGRLLDNYSGVQIAGAAVPGRFTIRYQLIWS